MSRKKQPWPLFTLKCLLALALMVFAGHLIGSRYRLGVVANIPCLPASLYLYSLTPGELNRGDQVAFKTDSRMSPHFQAGTSFIKLVQCVAGDEVEIDNTCHVRCLGPEGPVYESRLEDDILQKLGRSCRDFSTNYRIPPGRYFVVGTLSHSFDSRYWGLVNRDQVVGKVVAVLKGYDPKDREKEIKRWQETVPKQNQ